MLPDKSIASIKKGIWFIHKDELNSIKIYSSNLGNEKIYLNELLVSEHRSLKLESEHKFEDKNGNKYEVKFIVSNLLKGIMECRIIKNNEIIKSFHTSFKLGKNFTFIRFVLLILLSVGFAVISKKFGLPDFAFYIFIVTIILLHFLTRDNGEIVIEES